MNGNESQESCKWHPSDILFDGKCPECERQRSEEEAKAQRAKKAKIDEVLGKLGIGARYRECSFDNYTPTCPEAQRVLSKCQHYAETFSDRLKGGDSLFLLGNIGNGKNHLAAAICNSVAIAGFNPVHTSAIKIIRRVRATWKSKDQDEQQVIDSFSLPDVLVVDEIGRQTGSEDEKRLLFDVLNGRYEEQKPTIIISNLDVAGVTTYLGPALMDRLRHGKSSVLEFTWKSFRNGSM